MDDDVSTRNVGPNPTSPPPPPAAFTTLNPKAMRFARPDSRQAKPPLPDGQQAPPSTKKRGRGRPPTTPPIEDLSPDRSVAENMYQAQLRKEIALADQQRLKADEMAGRLIDADEVERTWLNLATRTQSALLRVPAEVGDGLAALCPGLDAVRCSALVMEKITQALENLGIELSKE